MSSLVNPFSSLVAGCMNSSNELKENELMSPMLLLRPLLFTSPVPVEMMVGLVVVLEKSAAKSHQVNIMV